MSTVSYTSYLPGDGAVISVDITILQVSYPKALKFEFWVQTPHYAELSCHSEHFGSTIGWLPWIPVVAGGPSPSAGGGPGQGGPRVSQSLARTRRLICTSSCHSRHHRCYSDHYKAIDYAPGNVVSVFSATNYYYHQYL